MLGKDLPAFGASFDGGRLYRDPQVYMYKRYKVMLNGNNVATKYCKDEITDLKKKKDWIELPLFRK